MSELIPLDEAARRLGVSVERLSEMRSNNEIAGVRVGANWKFKKQELDRVAEELGIGAGGGESGDEDDFELSDSSGGDSLELLSESGDDLLLDDSADGVEEVVRGSGRDATTSVFDDEDELLFGGSSLKLAADAGKKDRDTPGSADLHDDSGPAGNDPDYSTGKLLAALDNDDDPLALAPAEDELRLSDLDSSEEGSGMGSDFEDSEIVLDDSDSSSDLVLDSGSARGAGGRGGRDSALAASLDAGGSDLDDLELAPDDDVLNMGEMADQDAATMMQEDDFNLSPMEEADADESSGSQVIALEDSDLFSDSGVDPLAESGEGLEAPALLDDDGGMAPAFGGGFDDGGFGGSGLAVAGAGTIVGKPEVPYSLMQVLSLSLVAAILALGCTLLWDIARNLWMPSDRVLQSGLLKMTLDFLGIST